MALVITSQLPWPLNCGGHLRTFHLVRALARRFRVRLVTAISGDRTEGIEALEAEGISVLPAQVISQSNWREAVRAGAAAVRGEPYVVYRRHDRGPVRSVVKAAVASESPDIVYMDHLDSFVFAPWLPPTATVIDLHNVYSVLIRRTAAEQRILGARLYLNREARHLEHIERRAVRSVDAVLAVSQADAAHYRAAGARSVSVVPNGVDCEALAGLPAGRLGTAPVILYLGTMSWGPNARAANFLAREVLPSVRAELPEACLKIVGRDPSSEIRSLASLPGVEVTGSVPDVTPHLREAKVLAVPLEAGGGSRLKIVEAFAAGLPVVSTPVGCEGLDVADGEHLLVAQRPRFAEALLSALRGDSLGVRLAEAARALAVEKYDWSAAGGTACNAVEAALRTRRRPPNGAPAGSHV